MLSLFGLLAGLVLLIVLTMRGVNLFILAPLCALFVALFNGIPFWLADNPANFVQGYMSGFAGFVSSWFLMFLLGALFGKLMEHTGAADAVALAIVKRIGKQRAVLAVVLACAVLTYGGVSIFVVAFSAYPMAVSLFKDANLPRRFIPAALGLGSVTFTMTSAGSPEIQNWIPIQYLGTSPYAGWEVSIIVAIFMAIVGYCWLMKMIKTAMAKGEIFESREADPVVGDKALPHPMMGILPLLVVLLLSYLLHDSLQQAALIVALTGGVSTLYLLNRKFLSSLSQTLDQGATGALIAIGNTAAVVGFGSVAKLTPAFAAVVETMTHLPGSELIGAAVAVSVIAGLTGSASGGQAIALPEIAPVYLERGVEAEQLHRVVAISSGALDSLPHNGYVVTTIRAICGESHQNAYWPVAVVTVVVPTLGVMLAIFPVSMAVMKALPKGFMMKIWLGFMLLLSSFVQAAELPLVAKQQLELTQFTTQSGVQLKQVKVGWEAYGKPNADKSNVILITHYFSGTSHAAGKYRSTDAASGYWDSIIGPGKAIDTNQFYVLSVDSLANLNAFSPDVITTGPASINPATGKAYGLSFPVVTIRDFVEVQKALLDKLGIKKLYAVIGPSMGSFQAIEWAVSYPDKVQRLLPVIGTAYIDSFSAVRLERWAQPIKQDPEWHKGAYPLTKQPAGLTRALAYVIQDALHPELFNQSYPAPALDAAIHQDIQAELPAWNQLITAAKQRSAQMDANSLLYLVRASQLWRAGMGDNWQQKLKSVKAKTLWLPATGDLLLTPAMAKHSKDQMPDASYEEISGQAGHLDGLLSIQSKAEQIRQFLAK